MNGTINIKAIASDDGILNRIELKIDGQTVHLNATTTSLPSMTTTFSWNTSTSSDGSHTITAVATDNTGHNDKTTISVNVLNSPIDPILVVGGIGIGFVTLIAVTKAVSVHRSKASGKSPGKAGRLKVFNPQPEPPGKNQKMMKKKKHLKT